MKKTLKKTKLILLFFTVLAVFSCTKSGSEKGDEIIGKWHLVEVLSDDGEYDVSNLPCFKDSYVEFTKSNIKMFTSLPEGNTCETETTNGTWYKEDGYYYVKDEENDVDIELEDGILFITVGENVLVYTK